MNKGKVVAHTADVANDRVWSFSYTLFSKMLGLSTFLPTRMTNEQTLNNLGLRDDYYSLMDLMGLGNLIRMTPHLCTKLAKEFLAIVRLHYEDPQCSRTDEGSISFFIHRKLYTMNLFQLHDVLDFAHHTSTYMFENKHVVEF